MSIAYPLSHPTAPGFSAVTFVARSVVTASRSPFTGQQQLYAHQGQWWEAALSLPPMARAAAEDWIGFLLSLNGREGTFLLGDPAASAPRGSWAGTPAVQGAGQTGRALTIDGLSEGATVLPGDAFQLGSGATARFYRNLTAQTADETGELTLEIWPRLRETPADDAALVTASPKGLFRLASNETSWDVGEARIYGLELVVAEAI